MATHKSAGKYSSLVYFIPGFPRQWAAVTTTCVFIRDPLQAGLALYLPFVRETTLESPTANVPPKTADALGADATEIPSRTESARDAILRRLISRLLSRNFF
jgi:hypothetical protein